MPTNNLAMNLCRQGDFASCQEHFREVLRLDPAFEDVRNKQLYLIGKEVKS